MSVPVTVKWGKENYDVDVDTTEAPSVFKFQMYSLTGVQPERQKIMIKGSTLKDDSDWAKLALKPGQKLMMMGTADKIPEAPKQVMTFMEDLPEDEQDVTGLGKYGAGLKNLGNTCYMNSTLQCLYRIPDLRTALQQLQQGSQGMGYQATPRRLAEGAKDLFAMMERSAEPVMPMQFLLRMRDLYPQFAQQQPPNSGMYMQQDAEECWTQLLYSLKEALQSPDQGAAASQDPLMQRLMGVKLRSEMKCEESEEMLREASVVFALKCNITSEVNHLTEGIKLGLQDDREKNSEALGHMAVFKGESKIESLPPYLTVQMVRFFFKRDVQKKSKILRKVNFPLQLDLYEFCSEEYKKQLQGPREAQQQVDDRKAGLEKKAKDAARREADEKDRVAREAGKKRPLAESAAAKAETAKEEKGDVEMQDAEEASTSVDVSAHVGKPTGRYELIAVLTHKGRSADSGHYVSWAKQDDGTWIQFDDEEMIPRKETEIVELSGGGDWHMAYLLLYKAIRVQG